IRPGALGQTKFVTHTTGVLSVVNVSSLNISNTTSKGSTWFMTESIGEPILSKYPETKSLLEDTINLITATTTTAVPEDRTGIVMGTSGSPTVVYGESEIFVNKDNKLGSLKIFARAAGDIVVYF